MQTDELLTLYARGIFPGPGEEEAAFIARASKLESCGFVCPNVKQLYICAPDWLRISYSNKNLTPFEGGATWIDEANIPSVQLRKELEKGSYLRLYKRDEIIAHEAVHAMRMAFNENQFEEILAYSTSKSAVRRFSGPHFNAS